MRTSSEGLRAAARLRHAVTSVASRARAERLGELTLTQVAVLGRVLVEGPITPGEIGSQLAMAPQTLTRPLAALEDLGLIRRMPDPSGGRGSLITSTESGRRAMRAEMGPRDRWLAAAVDDTCTAEEQQVLEHAASILLRVAQHGGGVAPAEP